MGCGAVARSMAFFNCPIMRLSSPRPFCQLHRQLLRDIQNHHRSIDIARNPAHAHKAGPSRPAKLLARQHPRIIQGHPHLRRAPQAEQRSPRQPAQKVRGVPGLAHPLHRSPRLPRRPRPLVLHCAAIPQLRPPPHRHRYSRPLFRHRRLHREDCLCIQVRCPVC